jgi:hypothetical protein
MASASAHNAISQPIRNARGKSSIRSHDAGRPDSFLRSIKHRTPHMVQKRSLLANSRGANDCHTAVSGSDQRLVWLRNMLRTQILPLALALALLVVSKRASSSCLSSSLLGILPTTPQADAAAACLMLELVDVSVRDMGSPEKVVPMGEIAL